MSLPVAEQLIRPGYPVDAIIAGAMDDVDPGRTVDAIVAAGILAPRGKDIRTRGQRK